MSRELSLSVFFPAYNEEANIETSVKQAEVVLKSLVKTYELIIVDDGSRDRTGEIADRLAKTNPHIRVVHHHPNKGYGAAVWSGIRAARYDYVFFTDADLQFDLADLAKLLDHVPQYQAVLGYRAVRRDPPLRRLNARGWNILNRVLFGLKVRDIDCAFKLFKRDRLTNLAVKSQGAMLSAELLIRLQRQGVAFKEVPVTHLPRAAGNPTGAKPSVILRAFRELLQTYRGDLGSVTQRQVMKFAAVGLANTVLDIGGYFVLTRAFGPFAAHLVITKSLTYGLGSISGFVINRRWTFRRRAPVRFNELVRFYFTVGTAVIINTATLQAFLSHTKVYDMVAVVVATAITFVWNFSLSKWWVFTVRESGRKIPRP